MITSIDPEWAWQEYQPSRENPWTIRQAAHLFRRAGFGGTPEKLRAAVELGPRKTLQELVTQSRQEPEDYLGEVASLANATLATGNPKRLSAWWAYRMLSTPAQLLEKATLFWHGHFATSAAKVEDAELMFTQNNLLREFAMGDFAELLLRISKDPAMLVYLDSATNRKAHPNENYAREIMELFCLGEGNYTETDIRELARCFTGWEIKRKKFRFNRYQHDSGEKTVLGSRGKLSGEDGVRIVVEQPSAPVFLARKLVRFFVMDEPQPSAELLAPLAKQLRDDEMHTGATIERILSSNLFYSSHAIGRKVRSPVELAIGFLRTMQGSTNAYELAEALERLGQGLFYPPSVKGWDGGRAWINSATLLGRSNLIRGLLENEKTRFGRTTLVDHLRTLGARTPEEVVDLFEDSLFAVKIPAAARERIVGLAGNGRDPKKLNQAVHALCTLPEFQLC